MFHLCGSICLFSCAAPLTRSPSPPLQIEDIVNRIQDEKAGGVSIRTVKSFLSKIPSVVSGWCPCCIVKWWKSSLEPCGASVPKHHNHQSKDDLSGLIYIMASAAGDRRCSATEETARGATVALSHGRKASFLFSPSLCVYADVMMYSELHTSPSVPCPAPV